ncbi:MAG: hypothetical protein HC910_08855 [Spirulinaceae cyanobacterium SM2_1_0]|nr:hypothetical protein [Spirulinaceae cyanobacterium SM2_1_0]
MRPQFDQAAYLFHTRDTLVTIQGRLQRELLSDSGFSSAPHSQAPNFHVYSIQRDNGERGYLYLIRQDNTTALYLERDLYTLAELYEAPTQPMSASALSNVIINIGTTLWVLGDVTLGSNQLRDREPELLDKMPAALVAQGRLDQRFEIQGAVRDRTSAEVSSEITKTLSEQQYQVSQIAGYSGGDLYRIEQADAHVYLVVAQAQDEVVILSTDNDPRAS